MSKQVDDRVVSMEFDNRKFEQNVQTSMNTLEKLKRSLKFGDAAKGFDNIEAASGNVQMAPLTKAVETISTKFSALEVVAITTLANITNKAVNLGLQMVKSLSLDQVIAGWEKYSQKTASVQTLMNATGEDLETVNGYLDKLMWFSDETSYGFTDMTSALATMTSSGGDVESLIPLIEGVANATAYAGKGATEFQRAMYNINQSYSQGYLSLMDWKSLEQAGVSSEALKQTIIDTAVELGKISEGQIEVGTFASTLNEKWADKEVMESAFGKFAAMTEEAYRLIEEGVYENATEAYADLADQFDEMYSKAAKSAQEFKTFSDAVDATKDAVSTGWMVTFDTIFGNYEEQKALWTDVGNLMYDVFAASAEARNELLADWKELGGRDDLIEGFWNIIDAIKAIVKPVKDAFRDVFPKKTAEQLADATKRFKEFTEKLIISEKTGEKIRSTFKGLFAVLDVGLTIIKELVKGAAKIIGSLSGMVKGLFGVTGSFGDFLSNIRDSIKESGFFAKVIETIVSVLQKLIGAITNVAKFIKEKFAAPGWEFFYKLIKGIYDVIVWLGSKIGKIIGSIGSSLGDALQNGNLSNLMDVFNSGVIGAIFIKLYKIISNFGSSLKTVVGSFENITNVLSGVGDVLEAWQQNLQAKTIKTIAVAIAILAGALLVISFIDADKLSTSLMAIGVLFATMLAAMTALTKIGNIKGVVKFAATMMAMSAAVLILSAALKVISTIDWNALMSSLLGLAAVLGLLVVTIKLMSQDKKTFVKGAGQMLTMSVAVLILAASLKILASISWSDLVKSMLGLTGVMALLIGAIKLLGKNKKVFVTGAGTMLIMSIALTVLAGAMHIIAALSWEGIGKGLVGILGAISILVTSLLILSKVSLKIIAGAAAIAVISITLLELAGVLKIIASISWEDLGKSLAGLLGVLTIVVAALMILGTMSGKIIVAAASMAIMAASIMLLVVPLVILGALSWETIIKSLVALAAVFTILGVAAFVLAPVVPVILSLAGALALIGVSILAAGVGLIAFSVGLTMLSASIIAIFAAISSVIEIIVNTVLNLVWHIVQDIPNGLAAMMNALSGLLNELIGFLTVIVRAVLAVIRDCAPEIVATLFVVLDKILKQLVVFLPKLIEAVANMIIGILDGIRSFIPQITASAVELINAFLMGIATSVPQLIAGAFEAMLKFINGMIEAINTYIPLLQAKLFELAETIAKTLGNAIGQQMANILQVGLWIVEGLWNGIKSGMGNLFKNIKSFGKDVLNTIKSALKEHSPSTATEEMGVNLDKGMIVGIDKYANAVYKAGENAGTEAIDGMSTALSNISDVLDDEAATEPVIRPVMDLSDVEEGAGKINDMLSENAIDGAISKSASINSNMSGTQNGGYGDILKAINNLGAKISELSQPSYRIGDIIYDDGSEIATAIKSLIRAARIERRV